MIILAKKRARRKLENKDSTFRVRNEVVAPEKIDRFMKRKGLTDKEILNESSPAICKL